MQNAAAAPVTESAYTKEYSLDVVAADDHAASGTHAAHPRVHLLPHDSTAAVATLTPQEEAEVDVLLDELVLCVSCDSFECGLIAGRDARPGLRSAHARESAGCSAVSDWSVGATVDCVLDGLIDDLVRDCVDDCCTTDAYTGATSRADRTDARGAEVGRMSDGGSSAATHRHMSCASEAVDATLANIMAHL